MASADTTEDAVDAIRNGGGVELHVVQIRSSPRDQSPSQEISPLLGEGDAAVDVQVDIEVDRGIPMGRSILFITSRSSNLRKEPGLQKPEMDLDILLKRFAMWMWGGSRYSGFLCMILASMIYSLMEVITIVFSARAVPLFEMVYARSTIVLVLSFLWLRGIGQPILGSLHSKYLLLSRAFFGCLSLVCFIYSVKNLPLSYAVLLNFTTPAVASVAARMIFKEKLTFTEVGGMLCSFLGLLLIHQPLLAVQGVLSEHQQTNITGKTGGVAHIYSSLVGVLSSLAGGISYCLIKSAAKATDQPVSTVLAFGILASPLLAICTVSFEKFILPDLYTAFLILVVGALAFLGEVFLARALQLEKTSKVTNILFLKVFLTQIWIMTFDGVLPSFRILVGFLLVLASISSTLYFGPHKEAE